MPFVMAIGLYITADGKIMVAYGTRQIPLSSAQYKANGYKPSFERLLVKSPGASVPNVSVLPPRRLGTEVSSTLERRPGRYFGQR
jgi:hypothetical protein